ncbi:MAG: HupE/UreJ family protein [Pirellulales bacterium]|nr:HupE/UreJ family protein [Pirellulales bacterium]
MRQSFLIVAVAATLVLGLTTVSSAHPGHLGDHFGDGFTHPFMGWDHLLAMFAVGLLAVRHQGRAFLTLPATFLLAMFSGCLMASSSVFSALGLASADLTGVIEYGTISSVLILGILIAAADLTRLSVATGLVALFALFHGYAHVSELSAGGTPLPYVGGLLLSTVALHVAGIVGGLVLTSTGNRIPLRLSGAAVSAVGLAMLLSVI